MPKYNIYATITGGRYLGTVEADSKEEAEEKACDELDCYVSICHQCSSQIDSPEITDIEAEEVQE